MQRQRSFSYWTAASSCVKEKLNNNLLYQNLLFLLWRIPMENLDIPYLLPRLLYKF